MFFIIIFFGATFKNRPNSQEIGGKQNRFRDYDNDCDNYALVHDNNEYEKYGVAQQ